jgi:hypothetical protein
MIKTALMVILITATLNIAVHENYVSDTVPGEFDLTVNCAFADDDDDIVYIELDDSVKIFLDLLLVTGVISPTEKNVFDSLVEYNNGSFLGIGRDDLKRYTEPAGEKFTIHDLHDLTKTETEIKTETEDFEIPGKIFYYSDIRRDIAGEFLRLPGYRYRELYIILNTDEDNVSYINVLATRENGERVVHEPVRLNSDLSRAHVDTGAVFSEDILPMRYIFELLGETVGWHERNERGYITRHGSPVYFVDSIINSRTYLSVFEIMTKTQYVIGRAEAGEYIEIVIRRR